MPKITFTVDHATGKTSMEIEGIKGAGCKPIHAAFSKDLEAALGVNEIESHDTPEMNESAQQVANTNRIRQES